MCVASKRIVKNVLCTFLLKRDKHIVSRKSRVKTYEQHRFRRLTAKLLFKNNNSKTYMLNFPMRMYRQNKAKKKQQIVQQQADRQSHSRK